MMRKRKVAKISNLCVACGTCIKVCVLNAISITNGIKANVNYNKCVGCGKCAKACPASFIEIIDSEVSYEK